MSDVHQTPANRVSRVILSWFIHVDFSDSGFYFVLNHHLEVISILTLTYKSVREG